MTKATLSFYLVIISQLFFSKADAQHNLLASDNGNEQRTFFAGPSIGCNITQVDGDTYSGYHKIGLNVGGIVFARFSDHIAASLAITYSQKGCIDKNYTENSVGIGYVNLYSIKLNYIEVPVLLHFFTDNRLNLGLGFSYARLINAKETAETNYPLKIDPELYPFRKNDFNAMAEVNYEFADGWFIGARYAYSVVSIRDANKIPPGYGYPNSTKQLNNIFSFKLVYLIH